jgi:hypothetical protein
VFRLIKLDGKGSKTFRIGSRKVWFIRLARSYGVVGIWPVLHSRFCSTDIESSR